MYLGYVTYCAFNLVKAAAGGTQRSEEKHSLCKRKLVDLNSQASVLKERIDANHEKALGIKKEIDEVEKQISQLASPETKLRAAQEALLLLKEELQDGSSGSEISQPNTDDMELIRQKNDEVNTLEKEKGKLESDMKKMAEELEIQETEKQKLEKNQNTITQELESILSDIKENTKRREVPNVSNEEITELNDALEKLKAVKTEKEGKLVEVEEKRERLKNENDQLVSEFTRINMDVGMKNSQIQDLNNEIVDLSHNLTGYEISSEESEPEETEVDKALQVEENEGVAQLTEEIAKLKKDLEQLKELEGKKEKLQKDVSVLEHQESEDKEKLMKLEKEIDEIQKGNKESERCAD
ncbi:hypothetical protein ECANGB1_145 [Enterospora canceri]|uniref:Uncharacterized protein n=1 Tax=Enterospora canceri TaxID=1081671 RepID=A0A1Y1S8B5_9MICR|nr:hypothetical protein ECANGB1_145 [Enterospora canceri]